MVCSERFQSMASRILLGKRSLLLATAAVSVLGFCIQETYAYPKFAQQSYSNPRAANGKLACANCHLNQKAIEVEAPSAVLPNSVFEIAVKVPRDTNASDKAGGILILPKGFKLFVPKKKPTPGQNPKAKGVFISPYSTEFDNILVVGPVATGKTRQNLVFPVIAPDPEKNPDVKYLTYPFYAGGNRGPGQVYPTGEDRTGMEGNGPTDLGPGGFGQEEAEIILQMPVKIDVEPGVYPNCGSVGEKQRVVSVAVLGSRTFNVTSIDLGTLAFAGRNVLIGDDGQPKCRVEDVSGDFGNPTVGVPDGYLDLSCVFAHDAGISPAERDGMELVGELRSGTHLVGVEDVCRGSGN